MKGLSPRAQKLIGVLAQQEGRKRGNEEMLPEHVLISLLKTADGLGFILLRQLHINVLSFQLALEQSLPVETSPQYFSEMPLSRRMRTLFDAAAVESRTFRKEYVGTEHLLIAAIREEHSLTWQYFEQVHISLDTVRKVMAEVYAHFSSSADLSNSTDTGGNRRAQARSESRQRHSVLADFSRDLTALAKNGGIDPVIGREQEINRVIQILSRRTKNNPVLVGDPGVGKTAIVEGLAARIAAGDVPRGLIKKRILTLDMASVIAGTKFRGEFEERIKLIMKEIAEQKDIILFIDELHTIIGAGGSEGSLDASNMFKPALSRGEMQCIGATTLAEYRKYFEKDAALERRFQTVQVNEPNETETVAILNGIKQKYEDFHGVVFGDGVIEAAVYLSKRYITERFLPDKAIDIIDEAGAMKKIMGDVRPPELDKLEESIARLTEEKNLLAQSQAYERAAEVRDKVRELKEELDRFNTYWKENGGREGILVTLNDICHVIAGVTGIPAEQLSESESAKLLRMEEELHKSVIGQNEAVHLISAAVRRSRVGISSSRRPLGSFIFLGPTGVGKTQLAKSLAAFLFGTEESLIRVDMSDYMEKHTASRLVGAPPGYIGHEEGGMLTEQVRRHPYSVILLDEIEKAHPDIFNLLLQVLEEGELRDNLGHTVSFRNTVILMTSNAGARQISSSSRLGFGLSSDEAVLPYAEIKENALSELKKLLSPELLNRIDDVIVFNVLTKEEIGRILEIQLAELQTRLNEKGIELELSKSARSYLIEKGYDPVFGARPMRRLLQKELEDPLSVCLIENQQQSGKVFVSVKKDTLHVRFETVSAVETEVPV